MVEDNSDFKQSAAFKEYTTGVRKRFKPPWITIIIVGLATSIFSILTGVFAEIALENPYALNFVIGLYGIPAGFIVAMKNKTLSFLVSFEYASYSALIFSGSYCLFGFINYLINPYSSVGNLFVSVFGFLLTFIVIAAYSILLTFSIGALAGTFISGVMDSKK